MTPRWLNLATRLTRSYPFARGRGYLANVLLPGKVTRTPAYSHEAIVRAIPEGSIIRCRNGIAVRLHRDLMYVGPYLYGEYEARQSRLYHRLVRKGDVVVDAGANFGWYSALFAEAVGAQGQVYAFEPVPFIADMARDTISLNDRFGVVTLENAGLGEAPWLLHGLHVSRVPTWRGIRLDARASGRRAAPVHADQPRRWPSEEHGIEHIDFMKVDVKGFERALVPGRSRNAFAGGRAADRVRDQRPMSRVSRPDARGRRANAVGARLHRFLRGAQDCVSKVSGLVAGEGDYLAAKPSSQTAPCRDPQPKLVGTVARAPFARRGTLCSVWWTLSTRRCSRSSSRRSCFITSERSDTESSR